MNHPSELLESPCIRNCCLDVDDVCMGCYRSLEEIMQWGSADNEIRTLILSNARSRQLEKTV
ncbi:MAG: DUF1289 domain-containing protein [Gammaproteobacteria bacterium]|nr:DUF1289 domain-containing protein [Gammaproteobacteria bacterium]